MMLFLKSQEIRAQTRSHVTIRLCQDANSAGRSFQQSKLQSCERCRLDLGVGQVLSRSPAQEVEGNITEETASSTQEERLS